LQFAKVANSVGSDELTHKAIKDTIDDETDTHELLMLLDQIEPFGLKDLDRYLLRKSLDVSNKFDDYVEIANAARKFNETDIRNVAVYRAKKKKILQQLQVEKEEKKQEKSSQHPGQQEKGSGF